MYALSTRRTVIGVFHTAIDPILQAVSPENVTAVCPYKLDSYMLVVVVVLLTYGAFGIVECFGGGQHCVSFDRSRGVDLIPYPR